MPASLRLSAMETASPPRFLDHPLRICPALRPRSGRHAKPYFRHAGAAPALSTAKAPTSNLFRGSITRLLRSLSTLRRQGRPCPAQDSLPAAGYALPDGIGYPRGGCGRFLMLTSHLPPPPGLAWRDDNERELDRLLVTRTAYKRFEDSLLGFQTEMLEKYGNTDTFHALENNIRAWRQWWLEHASVRNMTDFEFGVSVLKCVAWTSANRE